jgi:predicted flavoprotein YhiN
MVNNQIARAVAKYAHGNVQAYANTLKNFTLRVTGTLGFDYAQVTKGGIPLDEIDENLQSKFVSGLYFAGETLDADGECGGFNLQWAYASSAVVAQAIKNTYQDKR